MKRIFTLAITLLMITSLAWVESNQPIALTPKAYKVEIGSYKFLIVTPLDSKRSVLVGVRKPLQVKTDSYLAEGAVALAISRIAKMSGKPDNSASANKFVKEMTQARALSIKAEADDKW